MIISSTSSTISEPRPLLIFIIVYLVTLVGCTNETSDDKKKDSNSGTSGTGGSTSETCNPIGEWKMTMTTGSGDCLPEDVSEETTTTIEQSDLDDIDKSKCQYTKSGPYQQDETEENYEIDGTLEVSIVFEKDTFKGTGILKAELMESGESVGSCEQDYTVSGSR